jgi:hypothetical protein
MTNRYLVCVPSDSKTWAGDVVLKFFDPSSNRAHPMRVFAYFPEAVYNKEYTSVLFVMHGVNRNAEETFHRILRTDQKDHCNPLTKKDLLPELHNFVLLVPEFSAELFPERNAYNFGNVFRNLGNMPDTTCPNRKEDWSFTVIDRIYEAVKLAAAVNTEGYVLWGHSAGAQFVHRLLAVKSDDENTITGMRHLLCAVAANAGSYTMPSFQEQYPFGFGGLSHIGVCRLTPFLHAPLLVLLGQADTDEHHKNLPTDKPAQRQGSHRLQRGLSFFCAALACAREQGTFCRWRIALVPGVGHDGILMLKYYLKHHWTSTYSRPANTGKV